MGVPLADEKLRKTHRLVEQGIQGLFHFSAFGRNTVFPCRHYSKLVNTQGIQPKTSKISELEKVVSILEV